MAIIYDKKIFNMAAANVGGILFVQDILSMIIGLLILRFM